VFLANGLGFANLVPRFPEIVEQLGLSKAAFGQAVAAAEDAQLARLDSLAFGGWEFGDVPAFIMPRMDDEVLLGMQVLRHFRWHQEGGVLRLQPTD